ncbi:hypothetical protein D3C81_1254930 [compost metagenome]
MRLTLDIHHFVARQFAATRLQELLQAGFRILVGIDQGQLVEIGCQPGQHAIARRLHAGVQVDGADQRFGGVGQDRLAAETAALQLARAQAQVFAQVKASGQYRQGLALDQPRAQARQLAFAGLGEALEQRFTGDEVEDRIAEELEAFVVAPGKTAVRQGQQHQLLVLEGITELALEAAQGNAHSVPTRSSWSKFSPHAWARGSHFATRYAAIGATVGFNALFKSTS